MIRRLAVVLAVLSLGACGGSSGRSPVGAGPVATPEPAGLAAGTTLSVVSGETGASVPGARIVVAGRELTTDGGGQATLTQAAGLGTFVDVVVPGFLDRQTLVRSDRLTRLALWPRTSVVGVDEGYTSDLVYTAGTFIPPPPGSSPLRRLRTGASQVFVVVSDQIRTDDSANAAHQLAVDAINDALQGRILYTLSPTRPSQGIVVDARIDPADPECQGGTIRAFTQASLTSGEITGARIVYCSIDTARNPTAAHELGHTFGLQHSPQDRELMFRSFSVRRSTRFGNREALVMRLMLERRGGNRFPDSDRDVAAAAEGTLTIACP